MSISKYLSLNREVFLNSIKKINLNILIIALIDYIFYSLIYFSSQFWFSKVLEKYNLVNLDSLSEFALESIVAQTQGLYYFLIYSTILLFMAFFIFSALSKSIVWALTAKTKITPKYVIKFSFAKLILNLLVFGIIFIISIVFKIEPLLTLFFVLPRWLQIGCILPFIIFLNAIYALLAKNPGVSQIKNGIVLFFKKIHYILFLFAIMLILALLINYIYFTNRSQYWLIFSVVLLLFYLAAGRYYIYEMVSKTEK